MQHQTVDLIMPTLGKEHVIRALESLRWLPFPIRAHFISGGGGWPQAINIGLKRSKGDVLLMDDDVELRFDTFYDFDLRRADITGFKLIYPSGLIQHAGGFYYDGSFGHIGYHQEADKFNDPMWVCHCTASLLYIRRHVVEDLKQMAVWEGSQFEDVDWSLRAIRKGYKILYWPSVAIHHESRTKRGDPEFARKALLNQARLWNTHEAHVDTFSVFPVPYKQPAAHTVKTA